MYKDIANLVSIARSIDADGFETLTTSRTEVFVKKQSVKRNEFYDAMQAGIKPTVSFELRGEDWELSRSVVNEKVKYADQVEFDGGIYDIIRAYEKENSFVELTCS